MGLEHVADPAVRDAYPLPRITGAEAGLPETDTVLDWRPLLASVLEDLRRAVPPGTVAARFHHALARGTAAVARATGESTVALSGGCFQNRLLLERTLEALEGDGFRVLVQQRIPPNDGGISTGQIAVAARRLVNRNET
jgi:hydrogenase maturation protein HypF